MDQAEQDEGEQLREASSVASFEGTSTAAFRREFQRCLQNTLSSCCGTNKQTKIQRYDCQELTSSLSKYIRWNQLCQHYDSAKNRAEPKNVHTPLEEIISILLDPRVVPTALSSCLLQVLAMCLLHKYLPTRPQWTSAQLYLLQSIKRIMITRQFREDLGSILISSDLTATNQPPPTLKVTQTLLKLIRHFVRDLKHERYDSVAAFFPCLLQLIEAILGRRELRCSQSCCCETTPTRRKRLRHATSDELHGEADSKEGPQYGRQPHQQYRRQQTQRAVSLKNVLQAKESEDSSCPHCQSSALTATVQSWCLLRDQCLHTMMALFHCTQLKSKQQAFRLLETSISTATNSPVLRVCVLQVASMLGRDGYDFLLESLWERAWQVDSLYLPWFAQVIVESSFCDDRQQCWESLNPLIQSIQARCKEEDTEDNDPELKLLLPCLGYILTRRRRLFETARDSLRGEFLALVAQLSFFFGDKSHWIVPAEGKQSARADHAVLEALHSLGILSLSSLLAEETMLEEGTEAPQQNASQDWRVPVAGELKQACERMLANYQSITSQPVTIYAPHPTGPAYQLEKGLLSDSDHDQKQLPLAVSSKPEESPEKESIKESAPLMSYLDDDVLRNIFSFLGYKKMLKLRYVCSSWQRLAEEDRFWSTLYRKRFGDLHDDSCKASVVLLVGSWKQRFQDKWLAQREIRFHTNSTTGFKHQICGYIGCHHVIKSEKGAASHLKVHERRAQKHQQALERQKARIDGQAKKKPAAKKQRKSKP